MPRLATKTARRKSPPSRSRRVANPCGTGSNAEAKASPANLCPEGGGKGKSLPLTTYAAREPGRLFSIYFKKASTWPTRATNSFVTATHLD